MAARNLAAAVWVELEKLPGPPPGRMIYKGGVIAGSVADSLRLSLDQVRDGILAAVSESATAERTKQANGHSAIDIDPGSDQSHRSSDPRQSTRGRVVTHRSHRREPARPTSHPTTATTLTHYG
jgi:hypothetical protein